MGKNHFKLILFAKSEKSQVPKSDRFFIHFVSILSSFWEPFGIIFSSFSASFLYHFLDAFLDLIFPTFEAPWCQNDGFWEPLGAQLGSKRRLKSAKWRQKVPKKYQCGAHIFRPISEIVSRALPGTILVDFGWIFNEF